MECFRLEFGVDNAGFGGFVLCRAGGFTEISQSGDLGGRLTIVTGSGRRGRGGWFPRVRGRVTVSFLIEDHDSNNDNWRDYSASGDSGYEFG